MRVIYLILLVLIGSCAKPVVPPPSPYGALPSADQWAWQQMEYYAFVHFNINTFSDLEWGHGTESPAIFNPNKLDCRQWARIFKEAGMKGIIITAKHHDGFCLWPSKETSHTLAKSPYKNGQGDILKELSEACKEFGLKFGVYLSPWDRNHPAYGTPEYNEVFKRTLSEVLTGYGDVFEVWFDGANGEGTNGKKQVYDWPGFVQTVHTHQPQAVIFSDAGPDIRWVGTEQGFANPTNWGTLNRDSVYPGWPHYVQLRSGHEDGSHWVPAEADVSIRPGWYYHQKEDSLVKPLDSLLAIWFRTVGRNANLLLNVPPDRNGRIHENDSAALINLRKRLDAIFTDNIALAAKAEASTYRGKAAAYHPAHLTDGLLDTYWTTDDAIDTATLTIPFASPQEFNIVALQEYLPLGQRVKAFEVDVWENNTWSPWASGTTIGFKRLLEGRKVNTHLFRIRIIQSKASPVINEISVYLNEK